MNRPQKPIVLYVLNDPQYLLRRLPLAMGAQSLGFQVHVAGPNDPCAHELKKLGFFFHPIPLSRRGMNPLKETLSLLALRRLYKSLQPTLLHHFTIKPLLYGSLMARILRMKNVVNTVTGMGYMFIQQGFVSTILQRMILVAYSLALKLPKHRIIFQNTDDQEFFLKRGIADRRDTVLIRGSGVDCAQFSPRPSPPGPPIVMLASRMLWDKGVKEFVQAARILKDEGCTARFVLVGNPDTGNPSSIPIEQLKAWAQGNLVEWWGFQSNMADILSQAYIVCLPSYREGTPRVLLEAAALAKPLVATDVPGCREVVKSEKNGLLVPPKNSKALADALSTILKDTQRALLMGQNSLEMALKEFSQGQVVSKILTVYRELLISVD